MYVIPLFLLILLALSASFSYLDWQASMGDFSSEGKRFAERRRRFYMNHYWFMAGCVVFIVLLW